MYLDFLSAIVSQNRLNPLMQMAKTDRSMLRAIPVYDNGRTSDLMMAPTINFPRSQLGIDDLSGRPHRGSTVGFLLFQRFSVGLAVEYSSCFISVF